MSSRKAQLQLVVASSECGLRVKAEGTWGNWNLQMLSQVNSAYCAVW